MGRYLFYNRNDGQCYYAIAQRLEYAYAIICEYFGTEYSDENMTLEDIKYYE